MLFYTGMGRSLIGSFSPRARDRSVSGRGSAECADGRGCFPGCHDPRNPAIIIILSHNVQQMSSKKAPLSGGFFREAAALFGRIRHAVPRASLPQRSVSALTGLRQGACPLRTGGGKRCCRRNGQSVSPEGKTLCLYIGKRSPHAPVPCPIDMTARCRGPAGRSFTSRQNHPRNRRRMPCRRMTFPRTIPMR